MHTCEIVHASRELDLEGRPYTKVEYKLLKDGEVIYHGNEGFPELMPADDIKAVLTKKAEAADLDAELAASLAEKQEAEAEHQAILTELNPTE